MSTTACRPVTVRAPSASKPVPIVSGRREFATFTSCPAALSFSSPERRVEGVNQKMLVLQLKELEKEEVASGKIHSRAPSEVGQPLSEWGALGPSTEALVDRTLLRWQVVGGTSEDA